MQAPCLSLCSRHAWMSFLRRRPWQSGRKWNLYAERWIAYIPKSQKQMQFLPSCPGVTQFPLKVGIWGNRPRDPPSTKPSFVTYHSTKNYADSSFTLQISPFFNPILAAALYYRRSKTLQPLGPLFHKRHKIWLPTWPLLRHLCSRWCCHR